MSRWVDITLRVLKGCQRKAEKTESLLLDLNDKRTDKHVTKTHSDFIPDVTSSKWYEGILK